MQNNIMMNKGNLRDSRRKRVGIVDWSHFMEGVCGETAIIRAWLSYYHSTVEFGRQ